MPIINENMELRKINQRVRMVPKERAKYGNVNNSKGM